MERIDERFDSKLPFLVKVCDIEIKFKFLIILSKFKIVKRVECRKAKYTKFCVTTLPLQLFSTSLHHIQFLKILSLNSSSNYFASFLKRLSVNAILILYTKFNQNTKILIFLYIFWQIFLSYCSILFGFIRFQFVYEIKQK